MTFIIEDKLYDTEKSEVVAKYSKIYEAGTLFGYTMHLPRQTILYKTKKGNWFSVSVHDDAKYTAYKENEESAKEILKKLNRIELYTKYFGNLDEA